MGRIKFEIRSKVKGKLVPIYLNYQDANSHFRIMTDFKEKQEYWNTSKEIIKPRSARTGSWVMPVSHLRREI
jgi:hypothetical protein